MISFRFNFEKGDFDIVDGKAVKITGLELVKNKIEKLLRTEYNKYSIYTTYGMPFHNWFYGQRDRELVELAMRRELSERIVKMIDEVQQVYNVSFEFSRNGVNISLYAKTKYGDTDEVNLWLS